MTMELWVPQGVKKSHVETVLQEWLDATSKHAYQNIIQDRFNSLYPRFGVTTTLYIITVTPDRRASVADGGDLDDSEPLLCAICHETDREIRDTLRCGHSFHVSCIGQWLRRQNTCPLCRRVV